MQSATFISVLLLLFTHTSAQTVGSEGCTVPPLSCFETSPSEKYDLTVVESDLSGITYNPETGTFFAVNNGNATIFEIQLPNTLLGRWHVDGVGILDPESVSSMGGRKFAVTDENPASIYTLVLPEGDCKQYGACAPTEVTKVFSGLTTPAKENLGFEGVAYMKGNGFYVVQESNPLDLYHIDEAGGTQSHTNLGPDGTGLYAAGGLTRGCDAQDEIFLMLKGPVGIHRFDLTSGKVTEKYAGQVCDMLQPEGITFYEDKDGVMNMVVVGEPLQIRIYKADPTCTRTTPFNEADGTLFQCPEKVFAEGFGCEKTYSDGGCSYSRCNKAKTNHNKICTDTIPGETDCTEMECMQHCNDSTELGGVCTHWAYDVAESECYIFEGCNEHQWDADYTTYIMQDPTCEKTIEDFPLGCEQRRCDKNKSNHNKICTDKEPGVTDCSLEECKAKCETHMEFTCTTYAYDVKEKECYLFETCVNEGPDEDYSTYVLIDPSCEKDSSQGGCPGRLCDLDNSPGAPVCEGPKGTGCELALCAMKCAMEKEFSCTAYAHDPTDMDCHLFEVCIGEGFSDDFNLYTMGYGEKKALRDEVASGCMATRNDGGCTQRRCSKSNQYNKICDKDEVPCSMDECEQKCKDHTNFTCSWYAFDQGDQECYLFETCLDEGDDADYDLFYLSRGCTATHAEGGCGTTRCNKKAAPSNKICDKDEKTCSLDECFWHCDMTTEFDGPGGCVAYAYDVGDNECYIYSRCEQEEDADYDLYLMPPGCRKTREMDGCPLRRCSKDNKHVKICDKDTVTCTMDECEAHCAGNADITCTHFAYDKNDMECYIFEGCADEDDEADYDLFRLYANSLSPAGGPAPDSEVKETEGSPEGSAEDTPASPSDEQSDIAALGDADAAGRLLPVHTFMAASFVAVYILFDFLLSDFGSL